MGITCNKGPQSNMNQGYCKNAHGCDCIFFNLLCCSYVQSACKIFKAAEECRLDRDEEKSYVLYMKYLTVYDIIKKRPEFKQQPV